MDCYRRHIGCHTMCTAFKDWKKEVAKVNAERVKEIEATPVLSRRTLRHIWRGMKK